MKQKAKVLLIEDHPAVRQALASLLEKEFEVTTAPDGRRGMAKALDLLPDVIVSDYRMPEADGLEVLARLRANPGTALIPFVLLTSDPSEALRRRAAEGGADTFLDKRGGPDELIGVLRQLLGQAAPQQGF